MVALIISLIKHVILPFVRREVWCVSETLQKWRKRGREKYAFRQ